MYEEKKKKKKKKAIIAGIIGSLSLIGVGGAIASIPETEIKNEDDNEEEKKKPPTPNSRVELATVLPQNKRNLGTIETNGDQLPSETHIQAKLPENIRDEVDITNITADSAIITAKANSTTYNIKVKYIL